MLGFHSIYALWSLLIVPLLLGIYLIDRKRRKKLLNNLGKRDHIQWLISDYSPHNDWMKFTLPCLAIIVCILAWTGPRKPGRSEVPHAEGLDIMIAWDLSSSMLAEDIRPNRLERARELIYALINAMPSDRIGLVFFAGHAYMQLPLTLDHAMARQYIQMASTDQLPTQGTTISEAITMCRDAFVQEERRTKVILLISDGEDHDEKANAMIPALQENGIVVYSIGVGTQGGASIPDKSSGAMKKNAQGKEIISKLQPAVLQALANETDGQYLELRTISDAVTLLQASVSKREKNATMDPAMANYKEYFPWLIGAALLLALSGLAWPERKFPFTK